MYSAAWKDEGSKDRIRPSAVPARNVSGEGRAVAVIDFCGLCWFESFKKVS